MKIKICGITSLEDARAAIDAGADYLGFNFYPPSPRSILPQACAQITSVLRREYPRVQLVGVFVNMPVAQVKTILTGCGLHLAQLHGNESVEMVGEFEGQAFKAVRLVTEAGADSKADKRMGADSSTDFFTDSRIRTDLSTDSIADSRTGARQGIRTDFKNYAQMRNGQAPVLLVDAAVKGAYGGTGVTADWSAAAGLARRYPLLLAGGLTAENVGAAARQVRPWGVDTASGVEASPGKKDAGKMKAFVAAVRAVSAGQNTRIPIEKAERADLADILSLQKLAYQSEAELNCDYNIPPLTQTFEQIEAEFGQRIFLKAVLDGQIIGSVRAHAQGDTCHIGRLIVHPDAQNRGIGSRLIDAIEAQFTCRRFELFTSQRSTRNLYLYRKLGYRELKQEHLSERITLVYLEKMNDNTTA